MVEITPTTTWRRLALFLLALLPVAGWMYAQPPVGESRRLESNSEYLTLIEQDRALQHRQDSVTRAMEDLRAQLRANPAERSRLSDEILQLEMQMFEIRSAKGKLVDRINELEQDWVLSQLEGSDPKQEAGWPAEPAALLARGPQVRNLVYNGYFRDNLTSEDYAALLEAQQLELQAVDLVNRYFTNYEVVATLSKVYETVDSEEEAIDIQSRIETLEHANGTLADSLATVWNYIFDNKSYAYGYVLDKLNRDQLLEAQEERLAEAMQQLAELRGRTPADEVADYFLRKQVSVACETEVAKLLGLEAARDSLQQVTTQLQSVDFRVPKIVLAERNFIDYEDITFPGTTKYTTQHPIPECRVYERGTIYRILLGRFSAKRAASLFKGAYPLYWLLDDARKWCYYAGGFSTLAEAEAAQKLMKEHGFIRPEIVVWSNGTMRNLSQEPEAQAYRVEIGNTEVLSEEIRTAISSVAGDTEVSKIGQRLFVVGLFSDRATAEAVADAVRKTDGQLQIKVTESVQ